MSLSILGTGSAVPGAVVTNQDISEFLDTSDEWITARTGIKQRRVCATERHIDLAAEAANKALLDANFPGARLDLIICTTVRGDFLTPPSSCMIQKAVGASCPAFDLSAACTGFIYALDAANAYISCGLAKYILIVSAEEMSQLIDWTDRATCVLFGDAAGAVVVGPGNDLLAIHTSAKGDDEALTIPRGAGNSPFSKKEKTQAFVQMNGQDVFKFAVPEMCDSLKQAAKQANLELNEITYLLPHQANIRIINAALSRLKLSKEKALVNIQNYGNTSSASIPLLLDESSKAEKFKKGDILALCAFGGGYTSGAAVIRWTK
jgi:3-oxoacyl-[acyl-carrier-protein] synthase-3